MVFVGRHATHGWLPGKEVLLSYNDCPRIRELYSRPGIVIESTSRLSNIAQRYEAGKQYAELLISNYDTTEWLESCRQMSLFDLFEESTELLKGRKIVWKQEKSK